MGVEDLENVHDGDVADNTERETDQEIRARQDEELAEERRNRDERLGTGPATGAGPALGYVVEPPRQPEEPDTYQTDGADPDADESVADFDADETSDDEEDVEDVA